MCDGKRLESYDGKEVAGEVSLAEVTGEERNVKIDLSRGCFAVASDGWRDENRKRQIGRWRWDENCRDVIGYEGRVTRTLTWGVFC